MPPGEINKSLEWIYEISSVLIAAVSLYIVLKTSPKEIATQTLIIFGSVVIIFIIIIIYNFISLKYKNITKGIKDNEEKLKEIQKELKFKKLYDSVDKRLGILEGLFDKMITQFKNKRAQLSIDPKIILWIILLIFFYLLLKSVGIIH